jgi:carbon monoxide dehydrogenase subunit G
MAQKPEGMGKVNFQGKEQEIHLPTGELYAHITDLRNFESLMPEQVIDWSATEDSCTFTIKNLSTIDMMIDQRIPGEKVVLVSGSKSPVEFKLTCRLASMAENITRASISIEADLNPMLKMMASRPLQNLADIMGEKMKEHFG